MDILNTYIQFINIDTTRNINSMDFLIQYMDRIEEDGIRELILDYIRMDLHSRHKDIDNCYHSVISIPTGINPGTAQNNV